MAKASTTDHVLIWVIVSCCTYVHTAGNNVLWPEKIFMYNNSIVKLSCTTNGTTHLSLSRKLELCRLSSYRCISAISLRLPVSGGIWRLCVYRFSRSLILLFLQLRAKLNKHWSVSDDNQWVVLTRETQWRCWRCSVLCDVITAAAAASLQWWDDEMMRWWWWWC